MNKARQFTVNRTANASPPKPGDSLSSLLYRWSLGSRHGAIKHFFSQTLRQIKVADTTLKAVLLYLVE